MSPPAKKRANTRRKRRTKINGANAAPTTFVSKISQASSFD
jgi:hypothetical protein